MPENESVILNLKVSPAFKRRIAKKAKEGGYGTVSNFIRSLLREAVDPSPVAEAKRFFGAMGARYGDSGTGLVIRREGESTILMVNEAYARMHGYSVQELIGKPITMTHADQDVFHLHAKMNAEIGPHAFIASHIRKDGGSFTALTETKAILDDKGNVVYRMALLQEIAPQR